jgi:hypothetical protein
MMIHEQTVRADGVREIRVRIPADLHVRLQSMRLLRGKSVSDAVTEALERYFAQHGWSAAAAKQTHEAPKGDGLELPADPQSAARGNEKETTELGGGLKITIRKRVP